MGKPDGYWTCKSVKVMNPSYSKVVFFLLALVMLGVAGCDKDDNKVPNVPVNMVISTTDPEFNDLNAVGGWIYLTGGSRGIVVYRFSIDEFMAYDRHCTYNPSDACGLVEVDQSGVIAEDACCGSKFILTDGTVAEGPAEVPLKYYQTSFDGNLLHIYN